MRKIGAGIAVGAVAAVILATSPAAAFGLRIGPFHLHLPHIGLPLVWHRHFDHHPLYMHANSGDLRRSETAAVGRQDVTSALLYPDLALSAIVHAIFWPADSSPWPFGYDAIFATAFARTPALRAAHPCQPSDDATAIIDNLRTEIEPTAAQSASLQKLGGALHAAAGYLVKACPPAIPVQPVARLQLMEQQLEALAMAVDIVRQPLQDFGQSLNDEQKARFATMIAPPDSPDRDDRNAAAAPCATLQPAIDRSIEQIDRSVQPTAAQRPALDAMKRSFESAATDLESHCPATVPPTALGRLEAIEARLDSSWRAVLAIQVALGDFQNQLSDAQKDRLTAARFAAR